MKNNNKSKSLYLIALLAVALLVGVGYAALTTTLNINGQTKINKATWDVHFENIQATDDTIKFYAPSDTYMQSPISSISGLNATTLNYMITLKGPDKDSSTTHDMKVDVVNNGTIDAKISNVQLPSYSSSRDSDGTSEGFYSSIASVASINCAYDNGSTIKNGDIITAGNKKTIVCKHHYKSASELTTGNLQAQDPNTTTFSRYDTLRLDFVSTN